MGDDDGFEQECRITVGCRTTRGAPRRPRRRTQSGGFTSQSEQNGGGNPRFFRLAPSRNARDSSFPRQTVRDATPSPLQDQGEMHSLDLAWRGRKRGPPQRRSEAEGFWASQALGRCHLDTSPAERETSDLQRQRSVRSPQRHARIPGYLRFRAQPPSGCCVRRKQASWCLRSVARVSACAALANRRKHRDSLLEPILPEPTLGGRRVLIRLPHG